MHDGRPRHREGTAVLARCQMLQGKSKLEILLLAHEATKKRARLCNVSAKKSDVIGKLSKGY